MSFLRPHPHRGAVIAAGALPLALASVVIDLRMTQWAVGARFVVLALIAGLVLAMGWLAPLEGETPRPYHSVLLVAGLLALIFALVRLDEVLGSARPPGHGGMFWIFGFEALVATAVARRANSGACTLIAAASCAVAVEEFVWWVFKPHGLGTFRAILFALALAFAFGAVRLRDRRRRHAVQLINAAGIATLVLAFSYLFVTVIAAALTHSGNGPFSGSQATAPFGWKLYVLAMGFGLIAYAAADREPGPAYVGAALLVVFAVLAGVPVAQRGSLAGWPLFLLLIGAGGLTVGLRPRRDLPPPPGSAQASPAPTVPLHPEQTP